MNLRDDYEEYTMAWGTQKQTLVPLSVFNESSARSIFQLMFGEGTDENMIDFNRLMELSMVSVFEIPDWVKSFFIIRFPQIVFKHEHAMTLDRKSTRLNSSHVRISYAVFCLKKKKKIDN